MLCKVAPYFFYTNAPFAVFRQSPPSSVLERVRNLPPPAPANGEPSRPFGHRRHAMLRSAPSRNIRGAVPFAVAVDEVAHGEIYAPRPNNGPVSLCVADYRPRSESSGSHLPSSLLSPVDGMARRDQSSFYWICDWIWGFRHFYLYCSPFIVTIYFDDAIECEQLKVILETVKICTSRRTFNHIVNCHIKIF